MLNSGTPEFSGEGAPQKHKERPNGRSRFISSLEKSAEVHVRGQAEDGDVFRRELTMVADGVTGAAGGTNELDEVGDISDHG
jgi:hypothetical protein